MNSPKDIVCFCNGVSFKTVTEICEAGATNLEEIYDKCGAGAGPCGGTCRAQLMALLEQKTSAGNLEEHSYQSETPPGFIYAASLFNRRYYWECHEALEELWLEEHGERKLFYQGLIQAAAALYHVLGANPKGVVRLAGAAAAKLEAYRPRAFGIPLEGFLTRLKAFENQAREILSGTESGFNYDRLPYIETNSIMNAPQEPNSVASCRPKANRPMLKNEDNS